MGAVISRMHEVGILSGALMQEAVDANDSIVDGSDLSDQKPRPRVMMESMNDEELSRIWGVLYQVPYQLTTAYRVGPIFLESDLDVEPREAVSDVNLDFPGMDDA